MKSKRISSKQLRMWKQAVLLFVIGFGGLFPFVLLFMTKHHIMIEPSTLKLDVDLQKHDCFLKGTCTFFVRGDVHVAKYPRQDCIRYITRPTTSDIRHRYSVWQVGGEQDSEIVVYSAYYDNRDFIVAQYDNMPVVAIFGVAVRHKKFYCHLWYEHEKYPDVVFATLVETGVGGTSEGRLFGQYIINCPLKMVHKKPAHVSVTHSSCRNATIYLEVDYTPMKSAVDVKWEHLFGMCLPISLNSLTEGEFIEWVELGRSFGITEFNLYNASFSSNLNHALKYYQNKGIVRTYVLPSPVSGSNVNNYLLANDVSLNDCMYRNMYRYKYLTMYDFDEIIVPRQHLNYREMLKYIDKIEHLGGSWGSYTFRNMFFYRSLVPDGEQPKDMRTMRYRTQLKESEQGVASRSILNPRQCHSLFNHCCLIRSPNTPDRWTIHVASSVGSVHHYEEKCSIDECPDVASQSINDDGMLRLKKGLRKRMDVVYDAIKNYN